MDPNLTEVNRCYELYLASRSNHPEFQEWLDAIGTDQEDEKRAAFYATQAASTEYQAYVTAWNSLHGITE